MENCCFRTGISLALTDLSILFNTHTNTMAKCSSHFLFLRRENSRGKFIWPKKNHRAHSGESGLRDSTLKQSTMEILCISGLNTWDDTDGKIFFSSFF